MVRQIRSIASRDVTKPDENAFTITRRALTFSQGCEYTGFSPSYMYKLTSAGIIPFSKPNGKTIFFDKEKLDNWLLSNGSKSAEQKESEAATYIATH